MADTTFSAPLASARTGLITECCGRWIEPHDRFCPQCGHECRVLSEAKGPIEQMINEGSFGTGPFRDSADKSASARTVTRYRVTDNGEGGFDVLPVEGSPDNSPALTDGTEVYRCNAVDPLLTALAEQEEGKERFVKLLRDQEDIITALTARAEAAEAQAEHWKQHHEAMGILYQKIKDRLEGQLQATKADFATTVIARDHWSQQFVLADIRARAAEGTMTRLQELADHWKMSANPGDWKRADDVEEALRAGPAQLGIRVTVNLPDIERVAAAVHQAWIDTKLAQGITTRPSSTGIEQMVPYADLPDDLQELDRSTVRAVYAAIRAVPAPSEDLECQ